MKAPRPISSPRSRACIAIGIVAVLTLATTPFRGGQAFASPPNTSPGTAQAITMPGALRTTDAGAGPGGVWFSFVAPGSGVLHASLLSTMGPKQLQVWAASPLTLLTPSVSLTSGESYLVNVVSPAVGAPPPKRTQGSFTLRIVFDGVDSDGDGFDDASDNCPGTANGANPDNQTDSPPFNIGNACRAPFVPPANDQVPGATTLSFTTDAGGNSVASINGEHLGEASREYDDASFAPSLLVDHTLWYRFTAPVSGPASVTATEVRHDVTPPRALGTLLRVSTVSPSMPTSGFDLDPAPAGDLVAGADYWLLVYDDDVPGPLSDFVGDVNVGVSIAGAAPVRPANDDFADAAAVADFGAPSNDPTTPVEGPGLSISGTTVGATLQSPLGEPDHSGNTRSVWYSFTAARSGNIHVSLSGASASTIVQMTTGTTLAAQAEWSMVNPLLMVAGEGDIGVVKDATYMFAVSSSGADGSSFSLGLRYRRSFADNFVTVTRLTDAAFDNAVKSKITTHLATHEIGEPAHGGQPASHSVWQRFRSRNAVGSTVTFTLLRYDDNGTGTGTAPVGRVRAVLYRDIDGTLAHLAPVSSSTGGPVTATVSACTDYALAIDDSGAAGDVGSFLTFVPSSSVSSTPVCPASVTGALSVNDVTVTEGDIADRNVAHLTMSLTSSAPIPFTVGFTTAPGTATLADFTSTSGTLSFAVGDLSKTVDVPIVGDLEIEGDEAFTVGLAAPSDPRIALARATGTVTVSDDDGVVATYAGDGTNAVFQYAKGIAVDPTGNVWVADHGNNRVRKIDTCGVVTTIIGGGPVVNYVQVQGVASDASGNIYVANAVGGVQRIAADGTVTVPAFNFDPMFADLAANGVLDIAVDPAGNLYIARVYGGALVKVTPAGVVSFFGGNDPFNGVHNPQWAFSGVTTDPLGNVYVADYTDSAVLKITPSGVVSILAGGTPGYADGTGTAARFTASPFRIASDAASNIYVADNTNDRVRKITPAGVVTTLTRGGRGFLDGPAKTAQLYNPQGIAVAANGTVFVSDSANDRIRSLSVKPLAPIQLAPTFTAANPPTGARVGDPYTYEFRATGCPSPAFTATGAVPPGLSLTGGVLSGTPTVAGSFTFTVTAANGTTPNASTTQTIVVQPRTVPPTFTASSPPGALIGVAYSYSFVASGTAPITFAATGTLPAGLTLNSSGLLSGTPTKLAASTFTVTASNGTLPNASITAALAVTRPAPPRITGRPTAFATLGTAYPPFTFVATGAPAPTFGLGTGPRTIPVGVTAGLPPGITVSTGGLLSGTPTAVGRYVFDVVATNVAGSDSARIRIDVTADPDLALAFRVPNATITKGRVAVIGLVVRNRSRLATSATMTVADTLPNGFMLVGSRGDGWTCSAVGQVVTCTRSKPLAGRSRSYLSLRVRVDAPVGQYSNTAVVRPLDAVADNSATQTITVTAPNLSARSAAAIPGGASVIDEATIDVALNDEPDDD